ncbi:hypothetical protein KBC40_01930 [Patescibacteria group bacterium]|nr:hypothetical protein [Patescibacteria group bacterium]
MPYVSRRIDLNARVSTVSDGMTVLLQAGETVNNEDRKEALKAAVERCKAIISANNGCTVYPIFILFGISLE